MNVDVYDTYVRTIESELLHFDVLLPGGGEITARHYANERMLSVGKIPLQITQENCRYCHTETVTPEVQQQINEHGYFIIQMECCPDITD